MPIRFDSKIPYDDESGLAEETAPEEEPQEFRLPVPEKGGKKANASLPGKRRPGR